MTWLDLAFALWAGYVLGLASMAMLFALAQRRKGNDDVA